MAHLENWMFPAQVLRVVDGDTVDLLCDLGLRVTATMRARLYGINAPEMNEKVTEHGRLIRRPGVDSMMELGRIIEANRIDYSGPDKPWVMIETHKNKSDSFGRWIVRIEGRDGLDLNRQLIIAGHAKPADYGRDISPYWDNYDENGSNS